VSADARTRLMPLRVPMGWAVTWNEFFEDDAAEGNGLVEDEDLLMLGRFDVGDEKMLQEYIDVGWYGGEDGTFAARHVRYCLNGEPSLMHEEVLARFDSRDRKEIAATVDRWLLEIAST
jgi:hypothetical protein